MYAARERMLLECARCSGVRILCDWIAVGGQEVRASNGMSRGYRTDDWIYSWLLLWTSELVFETEQTLLCIVSPDPRHGEKSFVRPYRCRLFRDIERESERVKERGRASFTRLYAESSTLKLRSFVIMSDCQAKIWRGNTDALAAGSVWHGQYSVCARWELAMHAAHAITGIRLLFTDFSQWANYSTLTGCVGLGCLRFNATRQWRQCRGAQFRCMI